MPWGESINAQGNVDALNQKIVELEAKHNNLSNLIDGMINAAKSQADSMIQDANDKATKIINDANQLKQSANSYLTDKNVEANRIISDAHNLLNSGANETAKLQVDKESFEEYKKQAQSTIDANNANYAANMNQLNIFKSELDAKASKLDNDIKSLEYEKASLKLAMDSFYQDQIDFNAKNNDLYSKTLQLKKDQDTLAQQLQNTYVTQKYLEDARAKLDALVKSNTDLQDSLNQRKATLDAQQATIASDMSALSLQKQVQDETDRTQSEKQRDIDLQVRALNQKIQVLNDLRASANQK